MPITDKQMRDLIRCIIEVANPLQIILFGSTARGEAGPESDVDVLVVVPDGTHRLDTVQAIYRNLPRLKFAVDIVVATVSDVRDYKDTPGLIYREAMKDGRVLYAA
jgi:predicted nucleotidyltransferase